jgi:ABC-2 type transport system ATP-binding protein
MIHIDNLSFGYGNGKGIRNVSFNVEKGAAVGFLGPNGSGKTTTIRCLLGFLQGTGICQIDGRDTFTDAPHIMESVGFIAGETAFPELMTMEEYFHFIISVRAKNDKQKIMDMQSRKDQLCEMFDLKFKGKISKMSKGMKQKVAIVAAFLHNPDILILDEPSSGLDPFMQSKFVQLVLDMKNMGKTILISSHIFEEVEKICDKIVIIRGGEIVVLKNIAELRNEQSRIFTITTKKGTKQEKIEKSKIPAFIKKLGENKDEILDLSVTIASLEDIYMNEYKEIR